MENEIQQYDRLPPHDLDAERALIGSMFLGPEYVPAVRAIVRTRDAFFQADHQIFYDIITDRHDAGKPCDSVLVREELSRRGVLEECGGTAYVMEILNSVPVACHAEHYARIVRAKYMWRLGIAACYEFMQAAYRPHRGEDAPADAARKAADAFASCSVQGFDDGFVSAAEAAQEAYDLAGGGESRFVRTGLAKVDEITGGVQLRTFVQIGGRPGTGKSQLARQIGVNVARSGRRAAIISVEETLVKIGANLLAGASLVKNSDIVFGRVKENAEWNKLASGMGHLSKLPLFINDKPVSLSEVVAAVTLAATKYRCEVVVVDYLQLIDPETGETENREITVVSRALKAAFKRLNVAGVVAVQLNRGNESGGTTRLPELRDLRGSGSLEQDGDMIVLLHREDMYHKGEQGYTNTNQIQAVVAKNKNGKTGVIPLLWNGDTQTISDWPEHDVFETKLPPGV